MHKVHKKRLLMLADALETRIPAEKFDLSDWRRHAGGDLDVEGLRHNVSNEELLNDCGTAGCAVGWACALPEFQAKGLRWGGHMPVYQHGSAGRVYEHFEAVQMFFGIDQDDAVKLFLRSSYGPEDHTNPLVVARRIRCFVAVKS